jgi:arsenate reductase|tara:strand:- start:1334 stop:1633 length:300 start_codon:yes stop_codon:yes gene_type:complete
VQLLKDRGIDPHIIEYLKNPPSVSDIRNLSKKLGLHPKEFIRTREPDFKEQKLSDNLEDSELLFEAMSRHPKIIERPIIVKENLAVLGRPPENILTLLD